MPSEESQVRKRLILALDLDDLSEVQNLVRQLRPFVGLFKVGHQLFTRHGPSAVRMIQEEGGQVFLDLKFHDIPNTVKSALEGAVSLKVTMVNFHALGGKAMMEAAAKSARAASEKNRSPAPILLAVTVLTSLLDPDLAEMGITPPVAEEVQRLSRLAYEAGIDGVVASPREISLIRAILPQDFLIVTPGVRLESSSKDDQKRFLSPREAIERGADYLVVGRPILRAPNPLEAARHILEDMALALT
jgi:orotidine-5'-phosphate decarboxylase